MQIRLAKEQADKKDKHKQQFLRKMEAEKLIDSQIQTKFRQAVRAVGQKPDKTEKEGNRQSKSRITFRNVQDAS